MKTLDHCYSIINWLNEDAHSYAYSEWTKADDMDEDSGEAEDQRCHASEVQRRYFVELYDDLDEETKKAIQHYRETDENFRTDFDCWYEGI
jgi:hypothetical protein